MGVKIVCVQWRRQDSGERVQEVSHGRKAPGKFLPEATPTNCDAVPNFSRGVTTLKQQATLVVSCS